MEKRSLKGGWPWAAAALLWTAFIWGNSLQTAEVSSSHSLGILALLQPLLNWTGWDGDTLHTLIRKLAHMTEFGVLSAFWLNFLNCRGLTRERVFYGLELCLLTALTDETVQLYVPGRAGMVADVWIDLLGAALAAGAVLLWKHRRKRE